MSVRISGTDHESTLGQVNSNKIGAFHMADQPNLYEPQRNNTFEFIVTGLDGIRKAGTTDTDNETVTGAQEAIRLSVSSAFVPSFEIDTISIKRGNSTVKYAGTPTFSSGSIQLHDYIGLESQEALYAWQALAYNVRTEKVGLASDYKKTAYILEYTPDYQLVRSWKLIGCWCSSVSEDNFSSDNNGNHMLNATIQYDKAIIDRD